MEGTWPENDIRRAFVAGAEWRCEKSCLTWGRYAQRYAEEEAEARYGPQIAERLKKEISQETEQSEFHQKVVRDEADGL